MIEALGGADECLLRISAAHANPKALEILAKEMAPAATSLAPGLTSLLGGRAHFVPRIRLVSFLWNKADTLVRRDGETVSLPTLGEKSSSKPKTSAMSFSKKSLTSASKTSLYEIAYARSGDKGNDVNIGVIARNAKDLSRIKATLSADRIKEVFKDDFDDLEKAEIFCWEWPGISAINLLLKNCLGGGGAYSLRIDPQGKAYAQRLLQIPISDESESP